MINITLVHNPKNCYPYFVKEIAGAIIVTDSESLKIRAGDNITEKSANDLAQMDYCDYHVKVVAGK